MPVPAPLRADVSLTAAVSRLWTTALAPRTQQSYSSGMQCFRTFLTMYNLMPTSSRDTPNISEDILIHFITHCHSALSLRYATIKSYLCGIRFTFLRAGLRNPLIDSQGQVYQRLETIARSIKKEQGQPLKPRLPITSAILRQMCHALQSGCFSPYMDILMTTVCCVAFFGFLRCGEFTCQEKFDTSVHLCIQDVVLCGESCALLVLKSSKTDPFRKGVKIFLHAMHDVICPVAALRSYLCVRQSAGARPGDPLFVDARNCALSRVYFLSKLKELLNRIGLHSSNYSGHSFRIGAATSAASAQVEDHLIKVLGRWNSDSFTRYIRTSQDTLRSAQLALCHSVSN